MIGGLSESAEKPLAHVSKLLVTTTPGSHICFRDRISLNLAVLSTISAALCHPLSDWRTCYSMFVYDLVSCHSLTRASSLIC